MGDFPCGALAPRVWLTAPVSNAPREPEAKVPFPRVFWVAIGLDVIERMAFYGVYINLSVYLGQTVGLSDKEIGGLLGVFALTRSWVPVVTGALSDKLGFRRSLVLSFALYALAYLALFGVASFREQGALVRVLAWGAVLSIAVAGAFLKPVIPGTVRRYAPPERRTQGFSIFYASVNAGSVVGKVLTKIVRVLLTLRASIVNSVIASLVGLGIALAAYFEPSALPQPSSGEKSNENGGLERRDAGFAASLVEVFTEPRLIGFLVVVSGYYLLIEQFYQTFPVYIVRMFGEKAPREEISLINPFSIALFQVVVARFTKKLRPLPAMAFGIFVGAVSMALMGLVPTLWGACGSFFVFAIAEMIYSPRYYEYVSSFAPKGREGLYMGLALVPSGLGGLVGGVLSGRLIAAYLPKGGGVLRPGTVWGTYAAIGVVCALLLWGFAALFPPKVEATEPSAKEP